MKRAQYNPLRFSRELCVLAGGACYAEMACHLGAWGSTGIEDAIRGGAISTDKLEKHNGPNRLLRGALPGPATLGATIHAFPKSKVAYWRDYGLWVLLQRGPLSVADILRSLRDLDKTTRNQVLDTDYTLRSGEPTLINDVELDTMRKLEQRATLSAFLALTALTRHAEAAALLRPRYWAASATYRLFPTVVGQTPHLYIRWENLLDLYKERVWRLQGPEVSTPWFAADASTIKTLVTRQAIESRNGGIFMPPDEICARVSILGPRARKQIKVPDIGKT